MLRPPERRVSSWATVSGVAKDGVKRKVAAKALVMFKQRVPRELTRRSGGRSMAEVIGCLRPYLLGWKAYFGLAQTPKSSGASWTNGCDIACGRFTSSTGSAVRPCSGNCDTWALRRTLRNGWGPIPVVGGVIATAISKRCSPLPISTDSRSPGSHDLNFSNRPVRTRMPGGVGGVGQVIWPPLSRCAPSMGALLGVQVLP